ncbi:MAG TPA: GNAT family N-acetyltransferase [Usitatibacter sp.]|nr:GNAT family N-acetyltransferase [Usitatibacter sp.]
MPEALRAATLFTSGEYRAYELAEDDVPRMQRFFDASPSYFRIVSGATAPPTEGRDEFDSLPPADWPQGRKWMIGFDADSELVALATLIADLFAPGVWHVGLFMVAESRWGDGGRIYRDLEAWMRAQGARWLRLGVILGNHRAERFWRREGYVETRRRTGFRVGAQDNVLIVMGKPLDGGSIEELLSRVPRDRPD